jgi:hypothetical protein
VVESAKSKANNKNQAALQEATKSEALSQKKNKARSGGLPCEPLWLVGWSVG